MTTNNKKLINSNVNKAIFSRVTFLLISGVSVVFNISSSHANTNLRNSCRTHEQFLIVKIFVNFASLITLTITYI